MMGMPGMMGMPWCERREGAWPGPPEAEHFRRPSCVNRSRPTPRRKASPGAGTDHAWWRVRTPGAGTWLAASRGVSAPSSRRGPAGPSGPPTT